MFGRHIDLFQLFGFQVRVDASWILIAFLVTWSLAAGLFPSQYPGLSASTYLAMGVAGALLLFLSIVLHETAHSVVARRYGIPMKGITLFVFGGVADMEREPSTAKSEFLMAAAGPATSVVLGFIFHALYAAGRSAWPVPVSGVIAYLGWINWTLAAFNLVPAFPLDGGRILRSALWHWKGDLLNATRISASIGSAFGVLLMIFAGYRLFTGYFVDAVWLFLIGGFLRTIAQSSYSQVLIRTTLAGVPVRRFMDPHPDIVPATISVEELVNDHIYRYHLPLFPVVRDADMLAGCVTTDMVRALPRDEWPRHTVQEITKSCSAENTITPDMDAADALSRMSRANMARLMVVDGGRLLGIVALKDLLEFFSTKMELEGRGPRREVIV